MGSSRDIHRLADGSTVTHDYGGRPVYGATGLRTVDRMRRMGYSGASPSTAASQLRHDRRTYVSFARRLDFDNWLFEATVNAAQRYILGATGFRLQAKTDVEGVNEEIENELWPEFAEKPEVTHRMGWRDIEDVNLRDAVVAGDQVWKLLGDRAGGDAGRIQHIESERIWSGFRSKQEHDRRVDQGVVLNRRGQITGFTVASVDDNGYYRTGDTSTLAAENAIFSTGLQKRSSQVRGYPQLVSTMPMAQRIEDVLTSEAVAWQAASRILGSMTRDKDKQRPRIRDDENADARDGSYTRDLDKYYTEVGMAILFQGGEDEELKIAQQPRPTEHFPKSVRFFINLYTVPLGMPGVMVLNDWLAQKGNYSSSRTVLLQAFISFRRWQQHLIETFYRPLYEWKIGQWIAEGRLAWRPSIWNHRWNVPSWPWIDEDKEVKAWAGKLDRLLTTQTRAMSALGQDPGELREERLKEFEDSWAAAIDFEEETGGRIKAEELWGYLSGLEPGKTERSKRAAMAAVEEAFEGDDETESDTKETE